MWVNTKKWSQIGSLNLLLIPKKSLWKKEGSRGDFLLLLTAVSIKYDVEILVSFLS